MPTLTVGVTEIPYTLRRSARARRLRIVVTPGRVEVVLPRRAREADARAFIEAKRGWVLAKTEAMRQRPVAPTPERFVSGARILFRGRWLRLTVEAADVRRPEIAYRTAFRVRVPRRLGEAERERAARRLVVAWLTRRALDDACDIARRLAPRLGVAPAAIRIKSQKTLWGSCGRDGVIRLNWRLIAAPRPVFEYVVVHELCHLLERNHGPRFWRLVAELLPGYATRRAWLREHGVALG